MDPTRGLREFFREEDATRAAAIRYVARIAALEMQWEYERNQNQGNAAVGVSNRPVPRRPIQNSARAQADSSGSSQNTVTASTASRNMQYDADAQHNSRAMSNYYGYGSVAGSQAGGGLGTMNLGAFDPFFRASGQGIPRSSGHNSCPECGRSCPFCPPQAGSSQVPVMGHYGYGQYGPTNNDYANTPWNAIPSTGMRGSMRGPAQYAGISTGIQGASYSGFGGFDYGTPERFQGCLEMGQEYPVILRFEIATFRIATFATLLLPMW